MKKSSFIFLCFLLLGCPRSHNLARGSRFLLDGPPGKEAVVYRVISGSDKSIQYAPERKVIAGEEIDLSTGSYFISNACTGYRFEHDGVNPTRVPLSRFSLVLTNADLKQENMVFSQCTDPVDGVRQEWTNQTEIDLLPGDTSLLVSGRQVNLKVPATESQQFKLDLAAIKVTAPESESPPRYFASPEENASRLEGQVMSVHAGSTLWLLPGNYDLEVNGTRRKVSVEKSKLLSLALGILRIETPPGFPMDERLRMGGQPVFAYIRGGVLFNLNTDYLVFPGEYQVSIEGSELREIFEVTENERTVVKTLGAVINVPPCFDKQKTCKSIPKITIHKDQHPYPLMSVSAGQPFLVLQGKYEYGVEGTRGLLRTLNASSESVSREALGRIRLKWEVKQATSRTRTDLVRLEANSGTANVGRTLDLLFSRPDEVFAPPGTYHLTFFVGDPQQERLKSKIDFTLAPGQSKELEVPVYMERLAVGKIEESAKNKSQIETSKIEDNLQNKKLPTTLVPLRRE